MTLMRTRGLPMIPRAVATVAHGIERTKFKQNFEQKRFRKASPFFDNYLLHNGLGEVGEWLKPTVC